MCFIISNANTTMGMFIRSITLFQKQLDGFNSLKFRMEFLENGIEKSVCCERTWSGKSTKNFGRKHPQLTITKRRKLLVGNHSGDVLENLIAEMKGHIEGHKKLAFCHNFSLSFLESMDKAFSCCIYKCVPPRTPLVGSQGFSTVVWC